MIDQDRIKTVLISVVLTLIILGVIGLVFYKYVQNKYPEIWQIIDTYDRLNAKK